MDIKKYLERISYYGLPEPTINTLHELQRLHLLNIPFENLDIHRKVKIDFSNLFDKVVNRKRGGFCYELNGLFYELLLQIGFKAKMVSARVSDGKGGFGAEFDHMAIIVEIEGDNYLVDVGFGEFVSYPIKIELNKEIQDKGGIFKIEELNDIYKAVTKRNLEGKFVPVYIFSEKERKLEEFYEMCNYHQTNGASHFTQKRICSIPIENGRITLTGNTLKITIDGVVTERILDNETQVGEELWKHFGIKFI